MRPFLLFLLATMLPVIICAGQDDSSLKQWFKGNLHTHSYWSDGDEFPEVIMDWYKSHNYQFLALTDHNTLTEGDKWKIIRKDSVFQSAFKNYVNEYGEDWVNYKVDSLDRIQVKLKTYDEYSSKFEAPGEFLIIKAEEITDHFNDKPIHLGATNLKEKIEPQGGKSVVEVLQNNIDAVVRQRKKLNQPMLVHVNHPNFRFSIRVDDMIALHDERFFEVYNGHHLVHNSGDSTHISTEEMWDLINIAYINSNKPMIYGLATDDSHNYHVKGRRWSNAGRGWIVVRADTLSQNALITAMEAGDFYASTGVELDSLVFEQNKLSVNVKQEQGVSYQITFLGCKKGNTTPEVFNVVNGNNASFELNEEHLFVRTKITSSKLHENPIEDLVFEMAWTQPVQPVYIE